MIEYFCLFPIYIKYVYKVTYYNWNKQKKNVFLTVLKIKNLKFGTKEAHFAILDSFSRGYRALCFVLLEERNRAISLVCVLAGTFLPALNLRVCQCRWSRFR